MGLRDRETDLDNAERFRQGRPVNRCCLNMIDQDQSQLPFEGLQGMEFLPRCEVTGQNADLHLVVYRSGEKGGLVAKILTEQARHLRLKSTRLSVPLWMITLENLERLEQRGDIPRGSPAAATIRRYLAHDRDATWKALFQAEPNIHQRQLALDDESQLPLGDGGD